MELLGSGPGRAVRLRLGVRGSCLGGSGLGDLGSGSGGAVEGARGSGT